MVRGETLARKIFRTVLKASGKLIKMKRVATSLYRYGKSRLLYIVNCTIMYYFLFIINKTVIYLYVINILYLYVINIADKINMNLYKLLGGFLS